MWFRASFAVAIVSLLSLGSSAPASAGGPGGRHAAAAPVQPQNPAEHGPGLTIPLKGPALRVSQPMHPVGIPQIQQRKPEREPSSVPGYNPLKRRHMAMPVLPGDDGSELAF